MIAQLTPKDLADRLSGPGLAFRTGPFTVRVHTEAPPVVAGIAGLYHDHALVDDASFCDFDVAIVRPSGLRRHLRPQARFCFDGATAFEPLPLDQSFALFEWAMNWCISTHVHQFLLIHAAVVERGGRAVILPAPPGSGKSTLCAALVNRGWRLLSDEIAMVPFDASGLRPLARPVSLKNQSIDIIRAFAPDATFSRPAHHTAKGTVAHMRAPTLAVERVDVFAQPAWVIFPRWQAGAAAELTRRDKADTLIELARNSFNYGTLGLRGFETMADLVETCACHDFVYGQLDDAIETFDALARAPS